MIIRPRRTEDNVVLVDVWERAVRATHHFLQEDDIQFFRPMVAEYLPQLEVLVAEVDGRPAGFVSLDGSKIEMLFIEPASHGQGIGKKLIDHVGQSRDALEVDVNEQNPGGLAFYLKCGFVQTGRSELDGSGRPFPLIHLARDAR